MAWLALYSLAVVIASLAGGWIPLAVKLTHRRMQIALSFVAGVMLGVGLLHLLPHGYHQLGSIDHVVCCTMVGFLLMFFLERVFHFHHHDVPDAGDENAADHPHDHQCDHGHSAVNHVHAQPSGGPKFSWQGAAIGLTLHGLVDGMTLAAGVAAEQVDGRIPAWAGLGAFLAIFLHKPFDSLTIITLMSGGRWSSRQKLLMNLSYALVTPAGVALFWLGASEVSGGYSWLVGAALGFAAGAFICIATSDLLPELQFHSHDRGKLSIALIAGVLLAWSIVLVETSGHDHTGHSRKGDQEHSPEDHEGEHRHDHR